MTLRHGTAPPPKPRKAHCQIWRRRRNSQFLGDCRLRHAAFPPGRAFGKPIGSSAFIFAIDSSMIHMCEL